MTPGKEHRPNDTPSADEVRRMLETQSQELIAQQKQIIAAYDQLEILSEKLKLADQMKDEFISMVVHELRNPLASVSQGIECARDLGGDAIPPQTARFLNIAMRNVRRLNRILGDLLDLAKLESGKLDVDLDIVDPQEMLADATVTFHAEAEAGKVAIAVHAVEDMPPILADPARLEQVLGNLVSNAIKFTPEGGTITMSAAAAEHDVLFSVADTGKGIAKEFQEIIFEKYRQLRSHEGGGKRGTGLGLPICRLLVKLHGGSIGVESEPGRGSRFFFTIPRYTVEGRVKKLMPIFYDFPPTAAWRIDLTEDSEEWQKAYPVVRGRIGEREWAVVDPGRKRIWILSTTLEVTERRLARMFSDGTLSGMFTAVGIPASPDFTQLMGVIDGG